MRGKGKKTKTGWSKGPWKALSQNVYSKRQAMAFGGDYAERTLKRSFKIVPAKGKRAFFTGTWKPEQFRRTKAGGFVEKTQFALNLRSEVSAIQKAKASAPKKTKWGLRL